MKKLALFITFLFVLSAIGCTDYGIKKQYGSIELYYTKGVTASEASDLGDFLVKNGFDNNSVRKTIQLAKSGDIYQFRIVVKKGLELDEEYAVSLKTFARQLSDYVFNGAPVEAHACDDHLKTLRVYPMRHKETQ